MSGAGAALAAVWRPLGISTATLSTAAVPSHARDPCPNLRTGGIVRRGLVGGRNSGPPMGPARPWRYVVGRSSMSAPLAISVLDQSPISEGSTGADALRNTIDLARLADALGFHRYWVAEHHGGPMLAGPSPEVLIGPIAAATAGIRVGSGGVMLPHYSPLKG